MLRYHRKSDGPASEFEHGVQHMANRPPFANSDYVPESTVDGTLDNLRLISAGWLSW
jgi:hypothetical protein